MDVMVLGAKNWQRKNWNVPLESWKTNDVSRLNFFIYTESNKGHLE